MGMTSSLKITIKERPGGYEAEAVMEKDPHHEDTYQGLTIEEAIGHAIVCMYQDGVITYDWPIFLDITLPAPERAKASDE